MPKKIVLDTTETTTAIIGLSEDTTLSDFLNAQKKGTKATYTAYLRRLREFTSESGSEILKNHKQWEKRIFAFQNWLIEKGYSETYAQSATGCLRGFFSYYRKPLELTKTEREKLRKRNRSTEDYLFDKQDLEKLSMCGNLKERYVLLVGKSLGLRAGDFVKLTYGKFKGLKLDNEAPIFLGETATEKEGIKAYPFLDSDAIPIVKAILEANPNKPNEEPVLMTKSKKKHNTYQRMRDEELSVILQSLARKANLEHGSKRIRFHCLRKYLIDRLSEVMSESKWKQIVGRKISESAYVSPNSLREDYLRAMPSIATSDNSSGKIKKELSDTKQSVETLSQIITDLKKENEELKARFAQNNLTMMMIDGKAMARENEIEVALSQLSKEVESLKKQLKTKIPSE
jgi:hypothetical protein